MAKQHEQRQQRRAYQAAWVRAKRARDPDYALREADRHAAYRATTAGFLARIRRNQKRNEERLVARDAAHRGITLAEAQADLDALRAARAGRVTFTGTRTRRIDLAALARQDEERKRTVLERRRSWRRIESSAAPTRRSSTADRPVG